MFHEALSSYRDALRYWLPLISVHLFVRLVSIALLVPVIGGLLALTLSFSNQSALTDQDIARFLLTPAGAIGALAVGSLVLAAMVVDVAVMTTVLRVRSGGIMDPLRTALGFLRDAFPRMILFAAHLILRVLLISLPFVLLAGAGAAFLLREFDINYYLTYRPPAFIAATGLAGVCLLAMGLMLVERFTAWAVALHYCIFDLEPPRQAFLQSGARMHGHRAALVRRIVAWFLLRLAAAGILATVAGFLVAEIPQFFDGNLKAFFAATSILIGVWVVVNAALNAIANGALSDVLNDEFNRCLEGRRAFGETKGPKSVSKFIAAPLIVLVLAIGSLGIGGVLSNRVGGVEDVQVIAHRGAAGSRPENTMASIVKAVEDGADWVEIDVQETADGQILVVHDSDFMKAAGNPVKVWEVTMPQIAGIDIGSWFDPVYAAERPPLLSEALNAVRDRSKLLIELKYYGHDVDLENRVIALVEDAEMQDQIATMSLKYPAVQKMLSLRPEWRTGVLAATAIGDLTGLEGDFIAVSMGRVTAGMIARADAAGKQVYAWTVNDAVSMSRMISLGIHGLITDEPALAREVLAYYETLTTPERLLLRFGDTIGFAFDFTPEAEEI